MVDRRWADHAEARLAPLAQELLAGKPEVVIVATTPGTQALMRLTKSVPIVMTGAADPVAAGLVASLSRPGGNVTGLSTQLCGVAAKSRSLAPRSDRLPAPGGVSRPMRMRTALSLLLALTLVNRARSGLAEL